MLLLETQAAVALLGSLMLNLKIFDSSKVCLCHNEFSNVAHKKIFAAIYNAYLEGAETIGVPQIISQIVLSERISGSFEKQNGVAILNEIYEYASETLFNSAYEKFKKVKLLQDLKKMGYNISNIYCEDLVSDNALEVNSRFDDYKVEDIVKMYKNDLLSLESKYSNLQNESLEPVSIFEGLVELVEDLERNPEVGAPLQGDYFNAVTRGGRKGKMYIKSGGSGIGKAIPDYTLIPTVEGFKRADQIVIGEYLFDMCGELTEVLGIYPQAKEKEVYRVHFSDGRVAECCSEHLWSFYYGKNKKLSTATIGQIYEASQDIDSFKLYNIPLGAGIYKNYDTQELIEYLNLDSRYELFINDLKYINNSITIRCSEDDVNTLTLIARAFGYYASNSYNYINGCYNLHIDIYRDYNRILKIEKTKEKTRMRCFYVDNKEHLFQMNDFIVTHNTRNLTGDACFMAFPIRYDSNSNTWIKNGSNEKVFYIATEQDISEIQTLILAYISDINEEKLLLKLKYLTENEKERLNIAINIVEKFKDNFIITKMSDPSVSLIKTLCRRTVMKHNVGNIIFDYIFSSPNLLTEFRDIKIREDVALMLLSTSLKDLAVELDCFVETATQISGEPDKSDGIKDYRYIRGSKSIVDKADIGGIISKVTDKDLEMLDGAITNGFMAKPNQVLDIYKNRRGQFKDIRIWSASDLGTCRREDLIVTDAHYNPIENISLIEKSLPECEEIVIDNILNKICISKTETKDYSQVTDKIIEKSLDNKLEKGFEFVGI